MASGMGFSATESTDGDWLAAASSAMRVVTSSLAKAPFGEAIEQVQTFRGELDSLEALLVAQRSQAGFSNTSTETIMKRSGQVSKGEARKRTKRSKTVEKNPKLAKKMADGSLSSEKVDLLSEADEKTGDDGAAANDTELIDKLENANPDQGKAIIRDYIDTHQSQSQRNSRYEQQRRRRRVWKEERRNGMSRLVIEGDDESVGQILAGIEKGADALYRADGGRDVPSHKHPRSNKQRLFDAAHDLLTGAAGNPASAGASSNCNRRTQRPTMVFTGKLSEITDDPAVLAEWKAELIGTGIVPTPVASYFGCISDFAAVLLDENGDPLWKGRTTRHATPGQWAALIVRDRGCVQCGAHHTRCQAHHQMPWTAPAKGKTNIDELVLLCVDCHQRLHELNHTIFKDDTGRWKTRPATWAETPANGPPQTNRANRSADRRTKPERATPPAPPPSVDSVPAPSPSGSPMGDQLTFD